jgi:heme oxygenase
MVAPYHPHAPRVAADLHALGESKAPVVPETQAFVNEITRLGNSKNPAVVGAWYVLEGSHNGGQYIAKALARSAAAEGLGPLRSFDAHGPDQRPRWAAWKAALDAATFTEPERREMVEAATAAFEGMEQMMHGLSRDAAWSA